MARTRVGGSFAPPLTPDRLERYKALAATAPEMVCEKMQSLLTMMEVFNQTPRSALPSRNHPVGKLASTGRVPQIVDLEPDEIQRIWNHVPWGDDQPGHHTNECDDLSRLFDGIDPVGQKELRDACFHLLWFARELAMDREPMTNDLL